MRLSLICSPIWVVIVALVVVEVHETDGQITRSIFDIFRVPFRTIRRTFINVIGRTASTSRSLEILDSNMKLQLQMGDKFSFPCNLNISRSNERPTSVHKLRPGDFDVVAAIGDSLTAANGAAAHNVLQVATENRGISWSIGGQRTWREFLTLPNILKQFNPKIFGYSTGDSLTTERKSQFNLAEAGAISADTPYMAIQLVKRIKNDPRVDLKNHWKIVTFMIGANDFCLNMCSSISQDTLLHKHKKELMSVLRTIRDNLPKTFVNLVSGPNVGILRKFDHKPPACYLTHITECPCMFTAITAESMPKYNAFMDKWQKIDEEVAKMQEFQERDDFTVVHQPFTLSITVPYIDGRTDYSYLSTDCFHLSQKGHANAANALWNNMMEIPGNKSNSWDPLFSRFLCPTTKHPYVYTYKNYK